MFDPSLDAVGKADASQVSVYEELLGRLHITVALIGRMSGRRAHCAAAIPEGSNGVRTA